MLHAFYTYVACVLSGCCIYFAMAFQAFSGVFTSVSNVCCKCFNYFRIYVANVLTIFERRFHLDVSKIDRMLRLSPRLTLARLSDAGDVRTT